MRNLRVVSGIFGLILSCNALTVGASAWSDKSHDIYYVDYRGDGTADDILVEAKNIIVGIPYDIDIELGSDEVSYILENNGDGTYRLSELSPGFDFDGERTSASPDFEILAQDLNNDGITDHFIQSKGTSGPQFSITAPSGEVSSTLEFTPPPNSSDIEKANYRVDSFTEAPSVVGTSEGAFNVSMKGSANYAVQVSTPEGLNGHTPNLSINYSDKGGGGILGQGWSLSGTQTIGRCSKTPEQDGEPFSGVTFSENDRLCISGQRLVLISGDTYWDSNATYKTEIDSLTKYQRSGENIKAIYNDGSESVFEPIREELWAISKETDRYGHEINYEYKSESASSQVIYPSRITYGESEIIFSYQSGRNDKVAKYIAGEKRYFNRFLKKISVALAGKPIREYNFHYKYSQGSGALTLKDIQLCSASLGSDTDECSLPLNIEYQPSSSDYDWKPFSVKSSFNPENTTSLRTMDWNRDGFDDLVRSGKDGLVEVRYGGPSGSTPRYETLDSGDEARYMVTPYITGDGERGLVYLTGELVQEEYQEVTKESYIEILDEARWKYLGYSCQVNRHCSTGWVSVDYDPSAGQQYWCDGNVTRSTVYTQSSSYNPPDQYGRQWVQRECTGVPESGAITLQGDAIGFYQEAYEVHPAEYDVIPYEFTSFKYSWNKKVLDTNGQFKYRSIAGNGNEPSRLCLDNEFASDFDPQTDLYDPMVGDFDADGEVDIYVAEPTCSSPDAKDVPWRKVVGEGNGSQYEGLNDLKNVTYNYDANPDTEIIERKNGRFFIHGKEAEFELKTSTGKVIASKNSVPVDVNADGLTDIVSFGRVIDGSLADLDNIYIYINHGASIADARVLSFDELDGFEGKPLSRILHLPLSDKVSLASRIRFFDHDKNGMPDLLILNGPNPEDSEYGNKLILMRGMAAADGEPTFEIQDMGISQSNTVELENRVVIFDADGDGTNDILIADGESYNLFGRGESYSNKATGFLTSYPNGDEKKVEVEYERLNDAAIHDFSWIPGDDKRTFSSPMSVVSRVHVPTPSGDPGTIEYRYKNAQVDLKGRGFLGFESLTKTSIYENKEETIYFWGAELPGVSSYLYKRQFPEFPYIGRVLARTVKNSSNDRTIRKSLNVWSTHDPGVAGVAQPYLNKRFSSEFDLEGNAVGSERTVVSLDNLGNRRSKVTDMGSGNGDPFKCIENSDDCGVDLIEFSETVETRYSAAHPTFLNEKKVIHQSPTLSLEGREVSGEKELVSITKYEPADGWPYVVGDRTESSGVNAADGVKETFNYQPTASGAARLASTTVESPSYVPPENRIEARTDQFPEYDYGIFPSSIINAEGHSTTLSVDYRHGKPTETTDANSLRVRQQYDPLGRVKRVDNPDGSGWVRDYEFCEGQICQNYSARAAYVVRQRNHDGSNNEVYYDQFGNEVAEVESGFNGQWIVKQTVFDQRGRKKKASYPYFAGEAAPFRQYTYEDSQDLQTVTFPDGSTETRYRKGTGSGQLVEVTKNLTKDEDNSEIPDRTTKRTETQDLRGKTVSISEYKNSSDAIVTRLRYDAKGRLIRTRNISSDASEASIIDVTYDDAGNRKILDDPDTGRTITTYNSVGEVVKEVQLGLIADNGNSKTFLYEYDRLGRKQMRTHPETDSVDHWYYDVDQDGRDCGFGRLCSMRNDEFSEEYAYGAVIGNLSATTTTITTDASSEPKRFVFSYGYDQFGRERQVEYPSGFTIRRSYRNGYRSEIHDVTNGADPEKLWSAVAYSASGKPREVELGSELTIRREFDERGLVRSIQSGTGTTPAELLQASRYGYDSDGNLISRENELEGIPESFTYDGLNRLITEEVGSNTWLYVYDDLGNLKKKRDIGGYIYGRYDQQDLCQASEAVPVPGPHAVTEVNGTSYCYDEFGNQINSDDRTVEYNHFNKPTLLTQASVAVEYKYGPEESRFQQNKSGPEGSAHTYYVNGGLFEEEVVNGISTQKSYVDGVLIDKRSENGEVHGQFYTLRDHLDSVVSIVGSGVTDGPGDSPFEVFSYEPFGGRDLAGSTEPPIDDRGFTDHEHIDEMNLIHMNGRVYDPIVGRFLSADIVVQSPEFSQSYNRYSYAWNNPLSGSDPTGYIYESSLIDLAVENYWQNRFSPQDMNGWSIGANGLDFNYTHAPEVRDLNLLDPIQNGLMEFRGNNAEFFNNNQIADAALGATFVAAAVFLPASSAEGALAALPPVKNAGKAIQNIGSLLGSTKDVVPKKPFALGIDDHLDDFAKKYNATTWKQFDDVENWQPQVLDKILDPNQKVLFNLDGVDVWGGVTRSASGRGGATDWELLHIRQNPQAWGTIDFIQDGVKVENPFQ